MVLHISISDGSERIREDILQLMHYYSHLSLISVPGQDAGNIHNTEKPMSVPDPELHI
jgi:hypothetical protein